MLPEKTWRLLSRRLMPDNVVEQQPEIFPRELGRKIVKAEEIRHESDYDAFYIASKSVTAEQIETAKRILELAEQYLFSDAVER